MHTSNAVSLLHKISLTSNYMFIASVSKQINKRFISQIRYTHTMGIVSYTLHSPGVAPVPADQVLDSSKAGAMNEPST